jgi:hypothetical protein
MLQAEFVAACEDFLLVLVLLLVLDIAVPSITRTTTRRRTIRLWRSRTASSANGAAGTSDMEGKAATGSGERAGEASEFQIRGSDSLKNLARKVLTRFHRIF